MPQPLMGLVKRSLDRNAFDYSLHHEEARSLTVTLPDQSEAEVKIIVKGMKKADGLYTVTGDVVEAGGIALQVYLGFVLLTTFEGTVHTFASQAAV